MQPEIGDPDNVMLPQDSGRRARQLAARNLEQRAVALAERGGRGRHGCRLSQRARRQRQRRAGGQPALQEITPLHSAGLSHPSLSAP